MDNPVPESEKLPGIAANLLCDGDFSSCRKFALFARRYNPDNPIPDRILAVADVLLAEKRRDPNDWYPILQLTRPDSGNRRLVRTQFEKLTALLNPENNSFPFSDEALQLVIRAWAAVSDPGEETRLRNGPKNRPESQNCEEGLAGETFWTVCPYCYGMFMYKKVFEECCLRCQICRKAFHGAAIRPPAPEILVEGKEQYYFTYGYFPMEYSEDPKKSDEDLKKKKSEVEGVCVVEISDDDEEVVVVKNVGGGGGFSGGGKAPVKRMKAPARRMKGLKTKTVVRSTKKRMGNVVSGRVGVGKEVELGGECGDGDGEMDGLEFYEGKDDVFGGIGDSP
ncbi:PREDICTED: uncharacterized protein LOC101310559 [Fragaria vesca subsp. vesca]|uniref:uncharacterized protein LOC101310559 n=1 Tax=Fragaria vesca subsp. vesca TaxID=101020 RepID=UPI0002C35D7E|nr:PREDICTED: uncharacterized protein LOC101310559 [Fragaria vesca subsp. vesca]